MNSTALVSIFLVSIISLASCKEYDHNNTDIENIVELNNVSMRVNPDFNNFYIKTKEQHDFKSIELVISNIDLKSENSGYTSILEANNEAIILGIDFFESGLKNRFINTNRTHYDQQKSTMDEIFDVDLNAYYLINSQIDTIKNGELTRNVYFLYLDTTSARSPFTITMSCVSRDTSRSFENEWIRFIHSVKD